MLLAQNVHARSVAVPSEHLSSLGSVYCKLLEDRRYHNSQIPGGTDFVRNHMATLWK